MNECIFLFLFFLNLMRSPLVSLCISDFAFSECDNLFFEFQFYNSSEIYLVDVVMQEAVIQGEMNPWRNFRLQHLLGELRISLR